MQRAVGGAISSTVEPVSNGLSRRRRNRTDAAQRCEAGFRAQSFRVAAGRCRRWAAPTWPIELGAMRSSPCCGELNPSQAVLAEP